MRNAERIRANAMTTATNTERNDIEWNLRGRTSAVISRLLLSARKRAIANCIRFVVYLRCKSELCEMDELADYHRFPNSL